MLSKFEVSGFKGFNENMVFDLSDVKNYNFNTESIKDNTVNKSIIYGQNGTGKTNLGLAILDRFYRDALKKSAFHRRRPKRAASIRHERFGE